MSLESFKSQVRSDEKSAVDVSTEDFDWHLSLDGYWSNIDERFFGEDTPNEPPLMAVPEKLAADMTHIEDSEYAKEIAEQLDFNTPSRYGSVVRVTFNDFSTWHWPVLERDGYNSELEHFAEEYIPQIIQWEAIVAGDNPQRALQEWAGEQEDPDYSWVDDISETSMDDDTRRYFNDNADWLEELSRNVDSVDVDIDTDDNWEDDW